MPNVQDVSCHMTALSYSKQELTLFSNFSVDCLVLRVMGILI